MYYSFDRATGVRYFRHCLRQVSRTFLRSIPRRDMPVSRNVSSWVECAAVELSELNYGSSTF
jgi:hypothetical protein